MPRLNVGPPSILDKQRSASQAVFKPDLLRPQTKGQQGPAAKFAASKEAKQEQGIIRLFKSITSVALDVKPPREITPVRSLQRTPIQLHHKHQRCIPASEAKHAEGLLEQKPAASSKLQSFAERMLYLRRKSLK